MWAPFVRNMLKIELQHNDLKLHGWITTPEGARAQSDLQYCYVNGRMMKDKLINHAIRQSYENSLAPEQFAAYILFIDIDPHQVDVNVHPAKHEVRFHQARLVHDFIYQALSDALIQAKSIDVQPASPAAFSSSVNLDHEEKITEQIAPEQTVKPKVNESPLKAIENIPAYPGRADYQRRDSQSEYSAQNASFGHEVAERAPRSDWVAEHRAKSSSDKTSSRVAEKAPTAEEVRVYQALMQTPDIETDVAQRTEPATKQPNYIEVKIERIGKAIAIVDQCYVLVKAEPICAMVSLRRAEFYKLFAQLSPKTGALTMQPLLVPLSLKVGEQQLKAVEMYKQLMSNFGIDIKTRNKQTAMVMGVPSPLRQQNLQLLIDEMLSYLATLEQPDDTTSQLSLWLTKKVLQVKSSYTLSESVQLLGNLEQLYDGQLPLSDPKFVRPVDFTATIAAFSS